MPSWRMSSYVLRVACEEDAVLLVGSCPRTFCQFPSPPEPWDRWSMINIRRKLSSMPGHVRQSTPGHTAFPKCCCRQSNVTASCSSGRSYASRGSNQSLTVWTSVLVGHNIPAAKIPHPHSTKRFSSTTTISTILSHQPSTTWSGGVVGHHVSLTLKTTQF